MANLAANMIALIHGTWVMTVVLGPLIAWKWRQFRPIHSMMMLLTILIILSGNLCPLTTLENQLRPPSERPNRGSFIATYLDKLFDIQFDPAWIFYGLVAWFVIWTLTYTFIWRRNPR